MQPPSNIAEREVAVNTCPRNSYCLTFFRLVQTSSAPRTVEEAVRCPHGRPPIPLLAFGFGGRVVAMRLQPGPSMGAATGSTLALGPLRSMRMEGLSANLAGLQNLFPPQGQVPLCFQSRSLLPVTSMLTLVLRLDFRAGPKPTAGFLTKAHKDLTISHLI